MQNLSELTRRLVEAQIEFVLIGGFTAVAHGATLVTRDVDICCRFSEGLVAYKPHVADYIQCIVRNQTCRST